MKTSAERRYWVNLLLATSVVAFVLWQYWNTFEHPALFADDYMNISRGLDYTPLQHFGGLLAPNHDWNARPLVNLGLTLLYRTVGVHPLPWISVLLGLHLANVFLGYFLALRLLQNQCFAAVAALAWGFSYLTCENAYSPPVMYDSMAFLFWTACLLLYLQDRETANPYKYAGALLCFFLGTRSKEIVVVLPLILLIFELMALDRKKWTSRSERTTAFIPILKRQWPFYAISLVFVILYKWGVTNFSTSRAYPYYLELSYRAFMEGMKYYLSRVTFGNEVIHSPLMIYGSIILVAVWAALLRQKMLIWTLLTFIVALLPVVFLINARRQMYLYLPLFSMIVTLVGVMGHTILRVLRRWGVMAHILAYAILALTYRQYFTTSTRYVGFIRQGNLNARVDLDRIVEQLKQWYPTVPDSARFYFLSLPKDVPGSDLFVLYMPRLLYKKESIHSSIVTSKVEEILRNEASHTDSNFFCFDFAEINDPTGNNRYSRDLLVDRTSDLRGLKKTKVPNN